MLRCTAARINAAVVGGASLDRVLDTVPQADPRDAALLKAISYGALRWHHRLLWQAGQLLSRPLSPDHVELAALIRVGLFQLQWLRIPDHAAVAATVEAAALIGSPRAKGLVNAVLRRFQRERKQLDTRMQLHDEARTSHSRWMLDLFAQDWPSMAERILTAGNEAPPMWLRVNLRRTTREEYLERLRVAGIAADAPPTPASAIVLAQPQTSASLPGYSEGLISVQDAAAQLAAGLLDLKSGHRVLDACAAPGGKAAHILETCPGLAKLVAVDKDRERLLSVLETFQRLGLEASTLHADAARPIDWWDGEPFDRILVDAPCSGLGVIRRHPDIKVLRRAADIDELAAQQSRLLIALWPLLAPGGRLVYATCTLTKRENQEQIRRFLDDTRDAVESTPLTEPGRQIFPGEANMDGFYYASLDKNQSRRRS
jgi:16S rRNA (cytosine967-C5)-methyltransferase